MSKLSIPVVDLKGKSAGSQEVPASLFGVEPSEAAVHFVCEGQRFRFYKKTACTKTRSAVHRTSKKSRKQKGTGSGRQGNEAAPHWVGGGVAFGPAAIKRDFKVNKKLRKLALASVLSDRHSSGQVHMLKGELSAPKTKSVQALLAGMSLSSARVGVVLSRKEAALAKSARNMKNVDVLTEEKWTTLDFVKTDSLIFSSAALEGLTAQWSA